MAEKTDGLSAAERAAVKERAAELRAQAKRAKAADKAAADLADVLEKIAALPDGDRAIAEMIHRVVLEAAPHLYPRTYYGMPAYALDGKVLCFLQPGSKFDTRYSTFGFEQPSRLDDGDMWATHFAVLTADDGTEARIRDLVVRATDGTAPTE